MTKDFLPPKSDVVFKLLFGDERNIDLLADFLKSVLKLQDDEFSAITIIDPHLLRKHPDKKLGIIDLKVKTKSEKIVHVEIQLSNLPQMPERIVEGKKLNSIEIARKFLKRNLRIDEIMEDTNLPREEIEKLRAKSQPSGE
jgi:hypothetical protein